MVMRRHCAGLALALALVPGPARPAFAQHAHETTTPADGRWQVSVEGQAFLTANLQERRFRDFHQVESQNWLMGTAGRRLGRGTLRLHGMVSLEPFTLRDLGSAQVFQTGETFEDAPLIDYQHPHDLVMGLAARLEQPMGPRARLVLAGGLVGDPALGPTAFMHRASARVQPTAPLGHHQLDSTHVTPGVVTVGVGAGAWLVETSAFRGREPDENRLDIDLGTLDSWSARASWQGRGLLAQVSGARLADPDAIEPGDVTRLTASIEYSSTRPGRPVAATVAWGRNDGRFAPEAAWLAELTLGLGPRGTAYGRGELVDKHILEAGGRHPPGFEHPHVLSRVGALTAGYAVEVARRARAALSVGADLTAYRVPANLSEPYGRPWSIHVYGRLALEH
ncbi:MAG: hypothetical protein AB7H88_20140 [Vicinamibacterales bacterium]